MQGTPAYLGQYCCTPTVCRDLTFSSSNVYQLVHMLTSSFYLRFLISRSKKFKRILFRIILGGSVHFESGRKDKQGETQQFFCIFEAVAHSSSVDSDQYSYAYPALSMCFTHTLGPEHGRHSHLPTIVRAFSYAPSNSLSNLSICAGALAAAPRFGLIVFRYPVVSSTDEMYRHVTAASSQTRKAPAFARISLQWAFASARPVSILILVVSFSRCPELGIIITRRSIHPSRFADKC